MLLAARYRVKARRFNEAEVWRDRLGRFAEKPDGAVGGALADIFDADAFRATLSKVRPARRPAKPVKLTSTPEGREVFKVLRSVYEGKFPNGFSTKLSASTARIGIEPPYPDAKPSLTIWIEGKVFKDGDEVGEFTRQLFPDLMAYHNDQLMLDPEVTGQRFGDAFYRQTGTALAKLGMDEEWLEPNIDVGGYAHARRGVDFRRNQGTVWRQSARTIANRIETVLEERGDDLTPEDLAQLQAWEKAFRAGDPNATPSAPELAAFGEGRYDWTDVTQTGREFPTWPGKQILLGSDWAGYRLWDNEDMGSKAFDPAEYQRRLEATYDEQEASFQPDAVRKGSPQESDFNLFHADLFLPPRQSS